MTTTASAAVTRRDVLRLLATIGFSSGCSEPSGAPDLDEEPLPWPEIPWDEGDPYPDTDADERAIANVKALMDLLIPAERTQSQAIVFAGALEVGAYELLSLASFVTSARSLGFVGEVPEVVDSGIAGFDAALRGIVSVDLDALSFEFSPWSPFSELPRARQIEVVRQAFADPLVRPLLLFVRAACFLAYLGAVYSDAGLQQIGFPPFENFEDGLAVSGYPRTTDGVLLDAQTEDLVALEAAGLLDDYTYNREPLPTAGDDLDDLLDENGDFR